MIRIICLPFAGGTTAMYNELEQIVPEEYHFDKIEYAGHGSRRREPYYISFQEMVEDVAKQINSQIKQDDEIVLFGYSMGSIVAYELMAQNLLNIYPKGALFASHESPGDCWESMSYHELPENLFFEKIKKMGGFPKCDLELMENKFFYKLHFLPVYMDYKLIGDYKISRMIQLDIPSVFLYSKNDILPDRAQHWMDILGPKGKIIEMGDNHFFINEHALGISNVLREIVERIDRQEKYV